MADRDAGRILPPLTLILSGARSGKSLLAEGMVAATGKALYLATAEAGDDEMATRIATHQARRGPDWRTIEEPLDLAETLSQENREGEAILIDCLTLWLSNLMLAGRDVAAETKALTEAIEGAKAPVVAVSNEVGMGLVPETKLGRDFRDAQGILNCRMAEFANKVIFVAAGLPLILKDETT